jgi:hypothetical protein
MKVYVPVDTLGEPLKIVLASRQAYELKSGMNAKKLFADKT